MERTLQPMVYDEQIRELARFAKALSHPTRVLILKFLASKSFCFTGDLVQVLPIAQSTVSQHLKELREAGLIQGTVTPPKIKYCVNPQNWQKAKELFTEFFA